MAPQTWGSTWLPTVPDDEQWKRELRFAARVQRCLLEAEPVRGRGFSVYGCSLPHFAVGGDYYDFIDLPDGGLRVVVADVMGKGFGAAMLMTMVRAAVRAVSPQCSSPGQLLRQVNDLLYQDLQRLESFVVMICVDIPSGGGVIEMSGAGAPPPLYLHGALAEIERLKLRGASLGLLAHKEYVTIELPVAEGDMLFLCTDGILEARNPAGEEMGWVGLGRILLAHQGDALPVLFDEVLGKVAHHTDSVGFRDDVTLVAVRFTSSEKEGEESLDLPELHRT